MGLGWGTVLFVLLAGGGRALACSCLKPSPADTVFSGSVAKIEPVAGMPAVRVTFDLDGGGTAAVTTGAGSAACGYAFRVGKGYEVHASAGEVSVCGKTRPL